MPITLKLGELVAAKPALERLVGQKFSITTSFKLARRLKVINEELTLFETKRNDLVKEYGETLEDGKVQVAAKIKDGENKDKMIDNPKWIPFVEKSNELLNIEITPAIDPIKISEFGDAQITVEDMILLGSLVVEDAPAT